MKFDLSISLIRKLKWTNVDDSVIKGRTDCLVNSFHHSIRYRAKTIHPSMLVLKYITLYGK
jgi:hypothetical protein